IAFLDHDDLWHQQKLEQQLQALQAAPQAAMAYSWIDMINESGQPIRRIHPTHSDKPLYPQLLARNFLMTASNPLMRRSSLVAIGGFDESIYGADDWDVFIRLAERSDLALSPHYHIQYRVVEGSGSANVAKIEQGCLQVIEKAFRSAPAKFKPIQKVALGKVYQFLCFRTLEPTFRPLNWHIGYLERKNEDRRNFLSPNYQ
ncbi:MAG: hypothetical protein O3A14_10225, partial [Cyanobacteria bacterium]|nr:hypothetical protein [Cyanobacteriota bacterium]